MFQVHLGKITVAYAGCPAHGLAAVDWRRAHGLPDATDNIGIHAYSPPVFEDERLCRLVADCLDDDADFVEAAETVALPIATVQFLQAMPPDWQSCQSKAPLTDEGRKHFAILVQALTAK